jgi:predicted nucleotidyltransferase
MYMDLKSLLEGLLGRTADPVARSSIRPRLKEQIESEAQYLQGLQAIY